MGRYRSSKAERRRAETKFEKAKRDFNRMLFGYLESEDGKQLLAAIRAFGIVAETDPAVADAARSAFLRHHPVIGPLLEVMRQAEGSDVGSPTRLSADEIVSDTQALEDFRRVLMALPSGKPNGRNRLMQTRPTGEAT
jgi:hypothetical protein